jgi:CRP/FNR family cyclic AMP-dependent transcriptional regulator
MAIDAEWPILRGLSRPDRERVVARSSQRSVARGGYIVREGESASALYLIRSGLVAIECNTTKGERATLAVLGPGDCLGELSLLDDQRHQVTASAVALEPVTVVVMLKADFDNLRRQFPSVERVLVNILRSQVTRLSAHLVDTLTEDARTKVLRTLCRLAVVFDAAGGNPIRLTLDRIKSMAGVTRKVTDIVAEIETMGLVRRGKGHAIWVRDLAGLEREAGLPPSSPPTGTPLRPC